jgi:hypothetical protein
LGSFDVFGEDVGVGEVCAVLDGLIFESENIGVEFVALTEDASRNGKSFKAQTIQCSPLKMFHTRPVKAVEFKASIYDPHDLS